MQFERDYAISLSFFSSLTLRDFPCEQKFLLATKFYTKAHERPKSYGKRKRVATFA